MNKPASKEPSMDEILSSIRQIIADEDDTGAEAAPAPEKPESAATPVMEEQADAMMQAAEQAPDPAPAPPAEATPAVPAAEEIAGEAAEEPLPLSPEQMIAEPEGTTVDGEGEGEESTADAAPIEMVIADDIAFDAVSEEEPALEPETEVEPEMAAEPPAQEEPAPAPAPLPDPDLSSQMADKLLDPAADAAVKHTFARLNALAIGGADLTLEGIVRDMLRPMLKEWLDENLPATVERMVEREIERVSRGG
ncbi:MAG TPA: DUF2497 domain-containing protein [Devosia sp.]|nr:DUF2497 domain-containing protein [Devosia sp.]